MGLWHPAGLRLRRSKRSTPCPAGNRMSSDRGRRTIASTYYDVKQHYLHIGVCSESSKRRCRLPGAPATQAGAIKRRQAVAVTIALDTCPWWRSAAQTTGMAMEFVKITKTTSAQEIAEQLLGMIRRGIWKPGEWPLPERELIDKLDVGRSTVREAPQILATLNIVQSNPGQGTFIKTPKGDEILSRRTDRLSDQRRSGDGVAGSARDDRAPDRSTRLPQGLGRRTGGDRRASRSARNCPQRSGSDYAM